MSQQATSRLFVYTVLHDSPNNAVVSAGVHFKLKIAQERRQTRRIATGPTRF